MPEIALQQSQVKKSQVTRPAEHVLEKAGPVSVLDPITSYQQAFGNQAVQRMLRAKAIQAKLVVNPPDDEYEKEADQVADTVMRMPEPVVQRSCPRCEEDETVQTTPLAARITPLVQRQAAPEEEEKEAVQTKAADGGILQCKEEVPEEEEPLQTKPTSSFNLKRSTNQASSSSAPPIIHEVLSSPGRPLDEATRAFMEPRFGHNFNNVKVHTDAKAAESARAVSARAYTVGHDLVFGAGEYAPETDAGRRLLTHEVTHTIQQAGSIRQKLQRTQSVTLHDPKKKRTMQVIIGQLRFTQQAINDINQYGALVSSVDQEHVGFHNDLLGYDPNYTDPTDPFRWSKLKDLIDSDEKILVQKTSLPGRIRFLKITTSGRAVVDDNFMDLGLTLPTESLYKAIYSPPDLNILINHPGGMGVSPISDTHYVYYSAVVSKPADSSMAHELFGHMWLAIKHVPFLHPDPAKYPADVAKFGALTAQHGILDPYGNIYTGTVWDFIDRYVGSKRGMIVSPTQNVGLQLLQQALTTFKNGFAIGATGTLGKPGQMNQPWSVQADTKRQWLIIENNYAAAPQSAAAQPGPAPAATVSTAPSAITKARIEGDLTAWYGTLDPDKQYVFIRFLTSVQNDRTNFVWYALADQLERRLSRPQGMAPPIFPKSP